MRQFTFATAIACLCAAPAIANVPQALIDFVTDQAPEWTQNTIVLDAIRAQNTAHASFNQGDILRLDTQWRREVEASARELISSVSAKPVSRFLHDQALASGGLIREVFIMDNLGLNVGLSNVTSDYWQGDEAKFTETYAVGPDAIHVSDIEYDDSSQTYVSQVSLPIVDPDTGAVIGAITFGVDASSFF